MRVSRIALLGAAACILTAAALLVLTNMHSSTQGRPDGAALIGALSHYAADFRDRGQPIASLVTLEMLVRSGHLEPAEARKWEGIHISFYKDADETRPQSIIALAVLPDGSGIALLGDGSVQQLTRARLRKLSEQNGQPLRPANGG